MQSKLTTPFGDITLKINGEQVDFDLIELPLFALGNHGTPIFEMDARFLIKPNVENITNFPVRFECVLDGNEVPQMDLETGERYASMHTVKNGIDLCFGCYDGSDDEEDFELYGTGWSSIEMSCNSKDYLKYAAFGVAWVNVKKDGYNDSWTWFAAEPDVYYGVPRYKCPCCGNVTLIDEPPGTFEICDICGWEDDNVQFDDPDYAGGANKMSLNQARSKYAKDNS